MFSVKRFIVGCIAVLLVSVFGLSPVQAQDGTAGKKVAHSAHDKKEWTGKTIWIVDVNTNQSYQSTLPEALTQQLQKRVPGIKINLVTPGVDGNPFFVLKQSEYPDAAILSLGICPYTTKQMANFASLAGKRGIPTVICYENKQEVLNDQLKWNGTYHVQHPRMVTVAKMPQSMVEAEPIARQILPEILEQLSHGSPGK